MIRKMTISDIGASGAMVQKSGGEDGRLVIFHISIYKYVATDPGGGRQRVGDERFLATHSNSWHRTGPLIVDVAPFDFDVSLLITSSEQKSTLR